MTALKLLSILAALLCAGVLACQGNTGTSTALDPKTGESPYHKIHVRNTIEKNQTQLSPCYDAYTATTAGKAAPFGSLKIDWRIDTTGAVLNAEVVRKSFNDSPAVSELIACNLNVICSWQFPEPEKKVYVVHHFHFGKKPKRESPRFLPVKKS